MTYNPAVEQPMPVTHNGGDIQSLVVADVAARMSEADAAPVVADIAARRQVGIQRYGTPLQANNGRDALRDLYDELLDAACYARQAVAEGTDMPAKYSGVDLWFIYGQLLNACCDIRRLIGERDDNS